MLVVDASVAIKWLLEEDGSERATGLFSRPPLVAPDLIFAEVSNALWRHVTLGNIAAGEVTSAVGGLRETLDAIYRIDPLSEDALNIAVALGHPVYDGYYLALARQLGMPLVTADQRLVRRVAGGEFERMVELL